VAHFLALRLQNNQETSAIVQALRTLALAQQAFKGLDGVAHEAYQRSSGSQKKNVVTTSVRGRAQRSAQRTSATAMALEACELCELLESNYNSHLQQDENQTTITTTSDRITTWAQDRGYQVLYCNATSPELQIKVNPTTTTQLSVLVLYDPFYLGGAGSDHGSIEDLYAVPHNNETQTSSSNNNARGKLIIIIGNTNDSLIHLLQVLDQPPLTITTSISPSTPSIAKQNDKTRTATTISVQPRLYDAAGKVLRVLQPILQQQLLDQNDETQQGNQTKNNVTAPHHHQQQHQVAIHLVGRSLAGGVACLTTAMLDGTLPIPTSHQEMASSKTTDRSSSKSSSSSDSVTESSSASSDSEQNSNAFQQHQNTPKTLAELTAWAKGRCSAAILGCPPCLSPNLPISFVTSILLGDDVACRTTLASLDRLSTRVVRHTAGQDSWWHKVAQPTAALTDALSMTVSSLKTAATAPAAANDPTRLIVPGRAYLIRPRRLGGGVGDAAGSSSIHEVSLSGQSSRREALRAAVLWQLDDIMLSNSLWKHHQLESYIHGLDRVQLRGVDDNNNKNDGKEEQ
jgi:hypothetical protein